MECNLGSIPYNFQEKIIQRNSLGSWGMEPYVKCSHSKTAKNSRFNC